MTRKKQNGVDVFKVMEKANAARIMALLSTLRGGVSPSAIAGGLTLRDAQVHRALTCLIIHGIVTKETVGRGVFYRLTAKGTVMAKRIAAAAEKPLRSLSK